ncbi:MAG: carbamoyltransferase HypF [Campylobacterota bacterium]|nr:carbamoyltransferase HypF [Campylobacterota bacterium]
MLFGISIYGIVQGVGFRPFIYNLALKQALNGYVTNNGKGVYIELESSYRDMYQFMDKIQNQKPPLSQIYTFTITLKNNTVIYKDFTIKQSESGTQFTAMIPSDIAMCKDCETELNDKSNRRYQYPFITCTNCGPRYSIIKNLPYDRCNTSMDKFKMCTKCKQEYTNPKDRRYHAQPIGCFDCGVKLTLIDNNGTSSYINCIDDVVKYIKDGKIVAIKGIGGYHLVCDAKNDNAVQLLRDRKNRPTKPFAVMVKDIDMIKDIANINNKERELLSSNKRPIVLCKQKENIQISSLVSPKIDQIGLFLPYTPIHTLILEKLNRAIVATSANISGEPLCKTYDEIIKLSYIWDYCLDNDRDIVNSCDDSIGYIENDKTFMLRVARGYSPKYLKLPNTIDKNILSLGANQKSTVCIAIKDKVILSPYIGDLDSIKSVEHLKSHIGTLKRIYNFEPDIIVCDKHPSYESSKLAIEMTEENQNLKLIQVQHHYAHILSTMGINKIKTKVLGVSFDGTGFGDDGNLWGGEFLVCDKSGYKRVGYFKYFKLLGGETAIKEPRRVALSFLFEIYGKKAFELNNHTINSFSSNELKTLFTIWKKDINSPLTSSCGRLFDCVASILNIVQKSSYEGESGLILESLYDDSVLESYKFSFENSQIDFSKIVIQILKESDKTISVSKFFNTLIEIIYMIYKKYNLPLVISGGVFQNRVLMRLLMKKIPDAIVPNNFVSNDGAISYGQMIYLSENY